MGGRHRNEGCLSAVLGILGVGSTIVFGGAWVFIEGVKAIL